MYDDDSIDDIEHLSLCEALDRVLNKGAVVVGEITLSVANVDLIYLGLQLVIASVETIEKDRKLPVSLSSLMGSRSKV